MVEQFDEEDGKPVWPWDEGAALPGGTHALARLGVGHRCETWLVWSEPSWCPAVLKVPRPHQVEHPRALRTLQREVGALAGAMHPGLPRLQADGTRKELPHVLVEYVPGLALDEHVEEHGALSPVETALLGVQLLSAAGALHARGLAHLDLKPANVMIFGGRPIVIDFGSAREIGAPQPSGRPIGTLGYAAPEQEECRPISSTMDVYGIGMILAEVTTRLFSPLAGMLEPDPSRRLTVREATLELARAVPGEHRPWPEWVDALGSAPVPAEEQEGVRAGVR
jgi:serine/threonine protein kinase